MKNPALLHPPLLVISSIINPYTSTQSLASSNHLTYSSSKSKILKELLIGQ